MKQEKINFLIAEAERKRVQGKFQKSIDILNKVILVDKNNLIAIYNIASAYLSMGMLDRSLEMIERFLQIDEYQHPAALNLYSDILIKQENYSKAIDILEMCNRKNPNHEGTLANLAVAFKFLKDYNNVIKYSFESIKININNKFAFNNLGGAFFSTANFDEARIAYSTALDLDSKFIDAIINMGMLEFTLGNFEESITFFERSLNLIDKQQHGDEAKARFFLSFSYLAVGRLVEGWENYEYGLHPAVKQYNGRLPVRKFNVPKWNGQDLNEKKLLIWREQGLGDEILFLSCLKDFNIGIHNIIVECDERMTNILTRSFPEIVVRPQSVNMDMSSKFLDFDYHLPMASMMKFVRSDISKFSNFTPYISTNTNLDIQFKGRINEIANGKRKIGICWRSGTIDHLRKLEYLDLIDFKDIFFNEKFAIFNLQYDECENEIREFENITGITINRWSDVDLKNDLDKVFSIIKNLDVVITAATAVLSMSGAIDQNVILFGSKDNWTKLGMANFPWFPKTKFVSFENERSKTINMIGKMLI